LVTSEVRERQAASNRAAQKTDKERFNLEKLNEKNVNERCQVTIRNECATVET
jgi:hypothetical protein